MSRSRIGVILAAGRGTRMGSSLPKVLHRVGGRTLLERVTETAAGSGCDRILVVVGFGADSVRRQMPELGVEWVLQREQLGTGHALSQVEPLVSVDSILLVLSGDVPLLRSTTALRLLEAADRFWGAMAIANLEHAGALGRVQRDSSGHLIRCIEARDANEEELRNCTVNAGAYALPAPEIFSLLRRIAPNNAQGEVYLPEALGQATLGGRIVACVEVEAECEAWGVNDPAELKRVEAVVRGGA